MTDKQAIKFLVDHGLLNKSATWADITPVVRKHPSLKRIVKTVQLAYQKGRDDEKSGAPPAPEMPPEPLYRCPGCGCDKPSDHDCEPVMVRLHSLEMRVSGLEEREGQ